MQKVLVVVFLTGLCYGYNSGLEEDILNFPILDYDNPRSYDIWKTQNDIWRQVNIQYQKPDWDLIIKKLCKNNDLTLEDKPINCENIKITPKVIKSDIKKRDVSEVLEEGSGDDAGEDQNIEENKESKQSIFETLPLEPANKESETVHLKPSDSVPETSLSIKSPPVESIAADSVSSGSPAAVETVPITVVPVVVIPQLTTVQPVEAVPPVKAVPPVEAIAPVEVVSPVETVPPVKASPPVEAEPLVKPEATIPIEPVVDTAPVNVVPPVEAIAPVEVVSPVETVPLVEAVPPVKASPPIEAVPLVKPEAKSPIEPVVDTAPVNVVPSQATPLNKSPSEPTLAELAKVGPVDLESKVVSVESTPKKSDTVDVTSTITLIKAAPVESITESVSKAKTPADESKSTKSIPEVTEAKAKEVEKPESSDKGTGSVGDENIAKNEKLDVNGRRLSQEEINDKQSGVAVYGIDSSLTETEDELKKLKKNESMKTASIGGIGESSESNTGRNDNKILITLFVAVLAVGVAAFAYNYIKKKKRTNSTSARNGDVKSNVEEGTEMKPLMKGPEESEKVEIKNEKEENVTA